MDDKPGEDLFSAMLNLRTWKLTNVKRKKSDDRIKIIASKFEDELDYMDKKEILTHFKDAKDYGRRIRARAIIVPDIDVDIPYTEIFGDEENENFTFEYDGDRYMVLDQYCMDPKCSCNDVTLVFLTISKDEWMDIMTGEVQFVISLSLKNSKYEVVQKRKCLNELNEITRYFLKARTNILPVLKQRYKEMKKEGRSILKERRIREQK